ncbi:MAG: carboxypeptidase M32 [Candidatus Zixiibacteriota bacterium]|nr:MAG: carboxypeptidase M32 [candidate division Zixibacteria bacterium]
MTAQEAYTELKKRIREISILSTTAGVLYWDQEAYMPRKADDHRAEQLAQISRLTHEWFIDTKTGDLLATVEGSDLVKNPESEASVNCREWRRLYDREVKLPTNFVEEFTRVTSKAINVWAEARQKSDFAIFQPDLEKIIDLCRKKADLIGYETEVYDALLDAFEPGAKTAEVESAFKGLRTELVALIAKIKDAPKKPDIGILRRPYDIAKQKVFAQIIAVAIGYDFEAGRIDETVHPCCNDLGPFDTRVLTRYYANDISEGITGTTHEVGHALYEMSRQTKEHWGTPMGDTPSLAIHESQSRTWENIVGRSREFWQYFYPQLQRIFYQDLHNVALDDFYGAMNWVAPSYIRVEADEATYNLHVMLRFEIERSIITGELKVTDIPGEWNSRFKDYLGIEVDKDSNGCLQDVHWAHGAFGYFPTYALGNLYAAQFWQQAQKDLPGIADDFAQGKFDRLLAWLRDNIHTQGFKYYSNDLCQRITGQPLSHKPLLDYLYDKYAGIYGITR